MGQINPNFYVILINQLSDELIVQFCSGMKSTVNPLLNARGVYLKSEDFWGGGGGGGVY